MFSSRFVQFSCFVCFSNLYLSLALLLSAVQVLEICAHFGGLQAARTEMMGLFVYDLGPIDEEKVTHHCRFVLSVTRKFLFFSTPLRTATIFFGNVLRGISVGLFFAVH